MSDDASFKAFEVSLGAFLQLTEEKAIKAQTKVTLQILRGCILGTPVDTGRMRSGWTVGIGAAPGYQPPSNVNDKSKKGTYGVQGNARVVDGATQLNSLPLGTPTFVVNNVNYAGWVNKLHKKHAGFVEAVVENVRGQFIAGPPAPPSK